MLSWSPDSRLATLSPGLPPSLLLQVNEKKEKIHLESPQEKYKMGGNEESLNLCYFLQDIH